VVAIRCAQHRFLRRCPRARGVARVVRRIVLARSWTLRRAAAALGVAQADVSDLMRGKHARFSRERLERSSSRSTACLSSREVTPLCQRLATHGVESTRFESLEQHDFARSRTSLHARTVRDNQSADCRTAAPIPSTCASRAAASPPNASPRRANSSKMISNSGGRSSGLQPVSRRAENGTRCAETVRDQPIAAVSTCHGGAPH